MNGSDATKKPRDRVPGIALSGLVSTFRCARCKGNRPLLGRRWRMVGGVRQFVCGQCVGKERV